MAMPGTVARFLLEGLVEVRREVWQIQEAAAAPRVCPGGTVAHPPSPPSPPSSPLPSSFSAPPFPHDAGLLHTSSASEGSDAAAVAVAVAVAGGGGGGNGGNGGDGGGGGAAAATAAAAAAAAVGAPNEPVPVVDSGADISSCSSSTGGGSDGGNGGSDGGGGGGVLIRFGRPEEVLPGLLTLAAEHNPQLRHVSLHHHLDVLEEAVEVEREVAGALRKWGAARGVSVSVHTYWDRTLYHPDDLPYHLYDRAAKASSQGGSGMAGGGLPRAPSPPHSPTRPLPLNADKNRFRNLPRVMTDFRKATQAAASVRPSLPAPTALPPLPPPFNEAARSLEMTAQTVGQRQQQQHMQTSEEGAAGGDWGLGSIPRTIEEVYDAAGARRALQRLQELVGLDYSQLLPPVEPEGPPAPHDPRTAFPFHAGYSSAVRRLRYYVWGHPEGAPPELPSDPRDGAGSSSQPHGAPVSSPPSLLYFTNTRAQAVGVDSSTKLSPFVALGCITSRQIHEELSTTPPLPGSCFGTLVSSPFALAGVNPAWVCIRARCTCRWSSSSVPAPAECDWLAMHLCIRDFFIFTTLKEGDAVLDERGIMGLPVSWRNDMETFTRWAQGRTGLPFVDANMRELAVTGWMSNRGRQNVASLLTKDLGVDWRWGAELFESLLVDCDVAVNYCNWNYFAGIGNDPRNRHFKTVTQPWAMTAEEAEQYSFVLGRDYPFPLVDPANHVGQLTGTGKRRNKAKAQT
ncbi:cryptochrome [Volvox carteri f. nagariensis]|uniref:Cryptochrome n=1 Tax=Volvox carteri f. nagariensis TaxID=3068 RepID=D8U9V0_VOLCA|nr:cryptochrome [Volvox carteri f. nagariensis]EFJ43475.1 cryptochrome [Volvox carteri f. nagariensis]|eukprot:XP_002955404.1 cryptochrome [Volvox carteri f. nagariensis]